jgi:hypothetical protein
MAANSGTTTNGKSIVLLVSYKKFDAILTGDGDGGTEDAILANPVFDDRLDCELVKLGHHGSANSSKAAWFKALSPEVGVVSATYDYIYGHPTEETVGRLSKHAVDAPLHAFRDWKKIPKNEKKETRAPIDTPDFSKAIYSTATNGNIVVTSDGTKYNVEFDSEPSGVWRN